LDGIITPMTSRSRVALRSSVAIRAVIGPFQIAELIRCSVVAGGGGEFVGVAGVGPPGALLGLFPLRGLRNTGEE
jgi:hypothetical protein